MAGDEYYLQVYDENKKKLDEVYLGQFRYHGGDFTLYHFVYHSCDDNLFKREMRLSDGSERYCVWDEKIINSIKKVIESDNPITEEEEMAYKDAKYCLEWIDIFKKQYADIKIYIVLFTSID